MKCYNETFEKPTKMHEGHTIRVCDVEMFEGTNKFNGEKQTNYIFIDQMGNRFYAPASFNRFIKAHGGGVDFIINKTVEVKSRVVNNIISLYIETLD